MGSDFIHSNLIVYALMASKYDANFYEIFK